MSDERVRSLERAAAAGDEEAEVRRHYHWKFGPFDALEWDELALHLNGNALFLARGLVADHRVAHHRRRVTISGACLRCGVATTWTVPEPFLDGP